MKQNENVIECNLEKEGFRAFYFPGTKVPEKAVILVGGSQCNEKTSIAMSGYLRKAGYNVLVLGYYLWKGIPEHTPALVPVDYAEKAIKWLKKERGIEKIAMTGASFGGLYTMLCASLLPDITCAIPVVPYDHILEGTVKMKPIGCSIFTFHGQELSYTSSPTISMMTVLKIARRTKKYGLRRFMRMEYDYFEGEIPPEGLTEAEKKELGYEYKKKLLNPKSRIKSENMNADVLLLAVENDDCWPSEVAVRRTVEKLKEVNYSKRVEYRIYEKGSHALTDGYDDYDFTAKSAGKIMVPMEGKYPKECDEARKDSLEVILKFIEEW